MRPTLGRNRWLPTLVLVAFFAIVYAAIFDRKVDLNGDNAAYLALAESLATGGGYHDLAKPGRPKAGHLPPGYPAFVAAAMHVSGDLRFLKALNGALFLAAVLLVHRLARRVGASPPVALAACLVILMNGQLLRSATVVMSETLFLVLLMVAIEASLRVRERAPKEVLWLGTAALALAAAFTVRTAGIATVIAIAVWFARARRFGAAGAVLAVTFAAGLPWWLHTRSIDGISYVNQLLLVDPYDFDAGTVGFRQLVERLAVNAAQYAGGEIAVAIHDGLSPARVAGAWGWLTGLAAVALVANGLFRLQRHRDLLVLIVAATFAMLLLWPSAWAGARFLHGILPILILAAVFGLADACARWLRRPIPNALLFALPLAFLPSVVLLHRVARADYPAPYAAFFRAADWIRENTPEDAVVCVRKPYLFHWRSRRACDVFPYTADTNRVVEAIEEMNASYVIVDRLGFIATPRFLVPALAQHSERFQIVDEASEEDVLVARFLDVPVPASR